MACVSKKFTYTPSTWFTSLQGIIQS